MSEDRKPNECCNDPANLAEGPGPRGLDHTPPEEVVVVHCTVCTCRHFEATLDPGKFGVVGESVG